ncbi:MAG TPA: PH domain-containing protein [Planctomycetota bacterium]|nr:PH domain-containing protein [Planctomycetota bacterium]
MAENTPPPPPPPQNDPPPNPSPLTTGAAPLPPGPAADAPPIFQGSVSNWMGAKSFIGAGLIVLCGLAALIFGSWKHADGTLLPKVGVYGGMALIAAGAIMAFYVMLLVRSHRYKITYRLIEREFGIFEKKVDTLDLGRVKHVDMKQSILERMFNVGTIEVYAGDANEPELLIEDIPNPRPVYERLRDAVIDLSRRRGVIIE